MYIHARMFCALAHMFSIPMGTINFYMQIMFFTLADTTFIPMNVMYSHARMFCTRSYILYSHGCNKFLYARTFFTLADTIALIFTVIMEVWPRANRAVVTNNSPVIIEVVLIEGFLYIIIATF